MKIPVLAGLLLLALMGAYPLVSKPGPKKTPPPVMDLKAPARQSTDAVSTVMYADELLGYRFAYPGGTGGYVLIHDEAPREASFLSGITLVNRKDYEDFTNATDAREGPGSIQLRVYRNLYKASAPVWALRHPQETNYALAISEPAEAVVGGANAVRFTADGLWPIDTIAVAHDSRIYLLKGMIPDEAGAMKADFQALVESMAFIRTPEQDQVE